LVTGLLMLSMSTAWKSSLYRRARGAWPVMHRMGMLSALAEYRPVIMSVPAGPLVPMHTPMLPAGPGVALGHVAGGLDVARQDVGDALPLAQCAYKRVDGGAGHAEGLRHAFLSITSTAAIAAFIFAARWPRCCKPRCKVPYASTPR
jgi:hypothetical protein